MGARPGRRVQVTGIRARFAMLVATAAVAPLLIYGVVSVGSLRSATEQSVATGNTAVARQIALRIQQYFENNGRVLASLGQELAGTQLSEWQQLRVLRNYVLEFPEFSEIALFDSSGKRLLSSRATVSQLRLPQAAAAEQRMIVTPPQLDEDSLPTADLAVPFAGASGGRLWIVAEISLEALWRTVDSIRIGQRGYAAVMDAAGRVIAHGNPDKKRLIASGETPTTAEQALLESADAGETPSLRRVTAGGADLAVVGARIQNPPWAVIIEQPWAEALAVALRLERQLTAAIGIALLATVVAGSMWGRSFIRRIFALTTATEALAAGRMTARVDLTGKDEIAQLGTRFNAMADRLVELQDEIRKQERQAMFGRIAAGLVHDLSHPIQTIGNSCKLIQRIFDDAEYRATFAKTVDRELSTVKRLLEDLRNMARPIPLERVAMDVNAALMSAIETMTPHAETAGLTLRTELSSEPAFIDADIFALGRVHRNLILNAIQATAPGGQVVVSSVVTGDRVAVTVRDTGTGIPPDRLHAIFEDFMTTKRRGLGLGLPISRKIVEQLGGRISVTSEVGKGTAFVLDFQRSASAKA
jgi:signal transduction histidine kinase